MTKLETEMLEKAQLLAALGPLRVVHASVDPVAGVCKRLSDELDALCKEWLALSIRRSPSTRRAFLWASI